MEIKSSRLYVYSVVLIVVLGVAVFLIDRYIHKDYEMVETWTSFEGRIVKIQASHGSSYIELTSGRRLLIAPSLNYSYSPEGFCRLATKGDSLVKKCGSDSIVLLKGNAELLFVIGRGIN